MAQKNTRTRKPTKRAAKRTSPAPKPNGPARVDIEAAGLELLGVASTIAKTEGGEAVLVRVLRGIEALSPRVGARRGREKRDVLALTPRPVHAGDYFISDDARLADVLAEMFTTDQDDARETRTPESFLRSVINSVTDDLMLLQLAAEHDPVEELDRIAHRLRHRLVTAQWLAERMRGADVPEVRS